MAKKQDNLEISDPRLGLNDLTASQNDTEQPLDNGSVELSATVDVKIPDRIERKGKLSGVPEHKHDGVDLERTALRDLGGFIEVVPAAPTHIPKNFYDQIKIFIDAGTPKLYVYDYVNTTWRVFT